MATNYPTALDTITNLPAAAGVGTNLATFPHSTLHGNANDALRAIETELGIDPSGTFASVKLRLDGALHLTGGTMTGPILGTTPTVAAHLTRKDYVDAGDALKFNKAGDTMTGDLTVAKTSPAVNLDATGASDSALVYFKDGGVTRWVSGLQGTNANWYLQRFNAAGVAQESTVSVDSTTGTVTFGAKVITPNFRDGTGSPEGVVTAVVGTKYIDTAATNGAIEWIKATGTGPTGWRVVFGDTGWRAITSWDTAGVVTGEALSSSYTPMSGVAGGINIRRVNDTMFARLFRLTRVNTTNTNVWATYQLPTGWLCSGATATVPDATGVQGYVWMGASIARQSTPSIGNASGSFDQLSLTGAASQAAWPAALPGTLAP